MRSRLYFLRSKRLHRQKHLGDTDVDGTFDVGNEYLMAILCTQEVDPIELSDSLSTS
jgi:hypothetical protein